MVRRTGLVDHHAVDELVEAVSTVQLSDLLLHRQRRAASHCANDS